MTERANPAGGRLSRLRQDLVAGAAIWALLTPLSIALAGLVGVPPVVGLATVPLALIGYVLFRGSRFLIVGPDAAVAVLSGSTLALIASHDVPATNLAATLVLLVGVFYLGFSVLRMGWIADLIPLGGANLLAGLGSGFAVAGSLSATAVNIQVGGQSQAASIAAAVLSLVVIAFLTPALASLPMTALAAIVIVVLWGLSDLAYFARLWSQRRGEFFLAVVVLLAVLLFDMMGGLVVGVVVALFVLGRHVHSPPCAVVGRTPAGAFVDVDEHSQAREIPGMLIWREYGPLIFLNARKLTGKLKDLAASRSDIGVIVIDATAAAGLDTTGASSLVAAARSLRTQGIELWLVNPRKRAWQLLGEVAKAANEPLPEKFDSLQEAVDHFERTHSAAVEFKEASAREG